MAAAAKVSITVVSGEREALKLTVKGSLSMGAVSSKYEKWLAKKTGRPQAVRLEHLDGAAVDLYGAAAALDGQAVRVVLAAPAEEEAAPAEEAAAPLAEEVAAAPADPPAPVPGKKKMGLKGAVGRGAKRRPTKKEKYARELERLAADYPETCGAAYDETREEEVFLLDLYVQNDVALGDAGVRRYVAENTTAAARLDGAAATLPRSSRERGAARAAEEAAVLTHARLELVVLDTGAAPSPFFSGDPAATADARVRYAHRPGGAYDDDATGAKRNELVQKARGAVVVQFDDDDVYTPSAWKWFDAARAAKPDADDAKLLHWYDNERDKTTGYCANYGRGLALAQVGLRLLLRLRPGRRAAPPVPADVPRRGLRLRHGAARGACPSSPTATTRRLRLRLHNNNSSVVAKHETFPLSDLDATFETPIGATIRDMRRARAFDTELSSYVSLARKARYEEGEFK
ncbi:protein serine/threonine phosphatase [Aureococcus anophagefferens]|nr:protein serine/threonine phosphatase [Aureococcus anophagefferens]